MYWTDELETLEEVVEDIGLTGIFEGTEADEATQSLIYEWFFDRPLCDERSRWLRYFRRRFSSVYPLYLARLRVSTVKGNMDPFVIDYMERIKKETEKTSGNSSRSRNGVKTGTGSHLTHQTGDTVREPNLTTSTASTDERTPDLTTLIADSGSNKTVHGTDETNTETRQLAHGEDATVTSNNKDRSFIVEYPEANLNGIPTDVDGYPGTIDYIGNEADKLGRVSTTTETEGTDTGTVTTTRKGSSEDTENRNNNSTTHNTGKETTTANGTTMEKGSDETRYIGDDETMENSRDTDNFDDDETHNDSHTGEGSEVEQGRHESVADILPRAIAAISGSNDILWLIGKLQCCFDCFSVI